MTENINKRPSKSILKTSGSIERHEQPSCSKKHKEQRFDEMNIIATLHPADKDYGHMKIEEPKTPYSEYTDPDLNPSRDEIDANLLAAKLAAGMNKPPPDYSSSSDEEEKNETPEERRIRLAFKEKRKSHYNEFQAIKLARKLMEEEEEDDDDNGDDAPAMDVESASAATSSSPKAKSTSDRSKSKGKGADV